MPANQSLLIDDAVQLLSPQKPYEGPAFNNSGGRDMEQITSIASFTFPKQWDDSRRWAVNEIIDGAIRRLAKHDRLYSDELGAAQFERDWHDDDHCHYFTQPGAITPNLDDVKKFIDTTLRKEFANPEHWVRKKTRQGTRYFVVGSGEGPDYGTMVRVAVYFLGQTPPYNTFKDMMVLNERPDGSFVNFFESPNIMVLQPPTNPEDGSKFVPLTPEKRDLRQGIEISERLARRIMPLLGVDIHRIKDEPRAMGLG